MLADCAGADIVLIEGYRDSDIKKLGVASSDTGYELPGPADDFEAIVTDDPSHFDKVTLTKVLLSLDILYNATDL